MLKYKTTSVRKVNSLNHLSENLELYLRKGKNYVYVKFILSVGYENFFIYIKKLFRLLFLSDFGILELLEEVRLIGVSFYGCKSIELKHF